MSDEIYDPLARFDEVSPSAGIKNPTTGIRETIDTAHRAKLRDDESKRKSQVSKHVIIDLMQSENGREWLYDMLHSCNVFGTPFTAERAMTDYNCGALFIGRLIESDMKQFSFKEYLLMLEEAYDRQKQWEDLAADKK